MVDTSGRLAQVQRARGEHGGETGYYERRLQALERLALVRALVTSAELDARAEALASDQHDDH